MPVDLNTLREFEETIKEHIPEFKVAFKDQSKTMKFLGFLAYPFNDKFLTRFTTTWGWTVYFPTAEHYVQNPEPRLRTLAHEFVHLWDTKEHGFWFKLSYAMPQAFALIPLLVYAGLCWPHPWLLLVPFVGYLLGALAAKLWRYLFWVIFPLFLGGTVALTWFLVAWWPLLALLAAVICLVPWPSPWRSKWELRGYTVNVAMATWMYGRYSQLFRDAIAEHFTGPNYYFMALGGGDRIKEALEKAHTDAESGTLQGLPPYKVIHEFLYQRGLLRS